MCKRIRLFSVALVLLLILSSWCVVPSSALSFDCEVEQYSDSMLMVNLDTGMEVFAKEADTKRYPAALTKVMTYIIAVEYFDDLATEIPV